MIDIQFGNLFRIDLLHAYYTNGLCNDFTIVPSVATVPVLAGHRIVVKQIGNQLYAGIQSTTVAGSPPASPPGAQPLILPEPGMQLTFYLQLQQDLFFNYTNLPSVYPAGKLYYFTNRNNNTANGLNFLSAFLAYDASAYYTPGGLATGAGNMVFECIQSAHGIAPSTANSAYWGQVDTDQYVAETDALQWMPAVSTWSFSGGLQSSVAVQVLGYDTAAGTYTAAVLTENLSFTSPLPAFTLDLSELPPGKYRLSVQGNNEPTADVEWIYLNPELSGKDVFAIIDVFNDQSLAGPYQLLSAADTLLSPVYSCKFLNRSTVWKYIIASGSAGAITDKAGVYTFSTPAASTIYSLVPIPLRQGALNLALTIGTSPPYNPIACPGPQTLVTYQPQPPGGDIYDCSEIYLNY